MIVALRDACAAYERDADNLRSEARRFLMSPEALAVAAAAGVDPDAFEARLPFILSPSFAMPPEIYSWA